jgi:signal transduction histidine kinase
MELILEQLGMRFRAEPAAEFRSALDRTSERTSALRIEVQLPHDLPPVFFPQGELANILENLIANAARAALQNADRARPQIRVGARFEGGHVILSVDDSGAGIAPEQRERISSMGPAQSGGHGRGLDHARRRLLALDGRLDFMTAPGQGTAAVVTLRALKRECPLVPEGDAPSRQTVPADCTASDTSRS